MKKEDNVIISLLRENSRISLTEMSRLSHVPVSTLYERLKSYQGDFIRKHTSLVDFSKLGFAARARVLLKVKRTEMPRLKEHLLISSCLNELYRVNNGYDFMAEFIFRTMHELEDYLDKLGTEFALEKEEVFYLVDEFQREGFMSKGKVLLIGEKKKGKYENI